MSVYLHKISESLDKVLVGVRERPSPRRALESSVVQESSPGKSVSQGHGVVSPTCPSCNQSAGIPWTTGSELI